MFALYKGVLGVLPQKSFENLDAGKAIYYIFRLILYILIFRESVFFIFFCYSLKFSGYSLNFKPSLFSNQYFFAY